MDWSARVHDVLYVVGGSEGVMVDVPQDNFNGITVAASQRLDGLGEGPFREVAPLNTLLFDAEPGVRTSIDLLAPGFQVLVPGPSQSDGDLDGVETVEQGTSLAAPHVTGAVALPQQHAETQISQIGSPRWGDNARRHEVMKAILLNSAGKLAGFHGSSRDIVKEDNTTLWTQTTAGMEANVSLDEEMGAGHLNVKSAFDNFAPGEYDPGMVPPLGWDYGTVGFLGTQEYVVDEPVSGWVAITLAWDRVVEKNSDGPYLVGDQFFTYDSNDPDGLNSVMTNLDVYLTPVGGGAPVHASITLEDNLEHVFFNVGNTAGNYKIEVVHAGVGPGDSQDYALAWWAGEAADIPGDFDEDGDVDQDDLGDWKDGFGSTYDGADFLAWQQNYGFGVPATPTSAAVPEPAACLLLMLALPMLRRRR